MIISIFTVLLGLTSSFIQAAMSVKNQCSHYKSQKVVDEGEVESNLLKSFRKTKAI